MPVAKVKGKVETDGGFTVLLHGPRGRFCCSINDLEFGHWKMFSITLHTIYVCRSTVDDIAGGVQTSVFELDIRLV
jgi:hypothetical protein